MADPEDIHIRKIYIDTDIGMDIGIDIDIDIDVYVKILYICIYTKNESRGLQ